MGMATFLDEYGNLLKLYPSVMFFSFLILDPDTQRHYSTIGPMGRTTSEVRSRPETTRHPYAVLSYPPRQSRRTSDNFDFATISPAPISPENEGLFGYETDLLFLKHSSQFKDKLDLNSQSNDRSSLPATLGTSADKLEISVSKRQSEPINSVYSQVPKPIPVGNDSKYFETRTQDRSGYTYDTAPSVTSVNKDSCDGISPNESTSNSRPDSLVSQRSSRGSRTSIPSFPPPSPESAANVVHDLLPQMPKPGQLKTVDEFPSQGVFDDDEDSRVIIVKDGKFISGVYSSEVSLDSISTIDSNTQYRIESRRENEPNTDYNSLQTKGISPAGEVKETTVPVNQDMYHNVNITNKPVNVYDKTNIKNNPSSVYDNFNIKDSPNLIDFSTTGKPSQSHEITENPRQANDTMKNSDASVRPTPASRTPGIKQNRTSIKMPARSQGSVTSSVSITTSQGSSSEYRLSVSSPDKQWNEAYEWNKVRYFSMFSLWKM